MSSIEAPSFCACLTEEFMNTVQREPRSTGCVELSAACVNSSIVSPMDCAKVCRNEPQPDEHASLTAIESITPSEIAKYFMSWPPMSMTAVTPGETISAPR